jgi:hypothetical protein
MNARVRVTLIREGTQRARLPTQEADSGGGGPKSGVEPGPRCSGSAKPARRCIGSGLECFCGERRSRAWKMEEGRSAASRAEAGRGRKREWGGPGLVQRGRREMAVRRGRRRCRRTGEGSGARATRRSATDKRGRVSRGPVLAAGCERERGERASAAAGR